jgi:hypothetical protein
MRDDTILIIAVIFALIGVIGLSFITHSQGHQIERLEEQRCNCTVNINGSIMGVEDAFYHLIEGLSADQAQEVQIMINNSLGEIK